MGESKSLESLTNDMKGPLRTFLNELHQLMDKYQVKHAQLLLKLKEDPSKDDVEITAEWCSKIPLNERA